MTTYVFDAYFSDRTANAIKEKMTGKTYLKFKIEVGHIACNYTIIISTDYEGATVDELRDMFTYCLMEEFGVLCSKQS